MRLPIFLAFSLLLAACSGVEIQPSNIEQFAAGSYQYYKWRTEPLPQDVSSSDPIYAMDPTMRKVVDATLQAKGYQLDEKRAQFNVGYLYALGMLDGALSGEVTFTHGGKTYALTVEVTHKITVTSAVEVTAPPDEQTVATRMRPHELEQRDTLLEGIAPPLRKTPVPP